MKNDADRRVEAAHPNVVVPETHRRVRPIRARGLLAAVAAILVVAAGLVAAVTSKHASRTTDGGSSIQAPAPTIASRQTGSAKAAGLRSVASWEALFNRRSQQDDERVYSRLSTSSDSWDYYNLAFGVDAYVSMYRATGNPRYLDTSLRYVNNVISRAQPSSSLGPQAFNDSFLGWVSQRSDVQGEEVPLFESFLWRYVTEMLWVIRQTATLYDNVVYRSQYNRILAFTEKNIFDKWYVRRTPHTSDSGTGFPNMYRQNTNMAAHWAFISMLLSQMTQSPTRRMQAVEVYTNVALHVPVYGSSLRGQFLRNPKAPAAYVWSSTWNRSNVVSSADVQDVPHGSGEVAYIVEAYALGIEWTSADITALSHTLTDVIWKSDGSFAANVDGSGKGNGVIIDGFMKLGRYSVLIQKRLENYPGAISDNNFAVIDFYANGALNARFLGA